MRHRAYLIAGLFTLANIIPGISRATDTIQKIKNAEDQIHEEMISISRQLGITCATCHNTGNFRDGSKNEFKVALDHMRIVKILRDNGFSGKMGQGPKADCYMCHRGTLTPDYKEVVNPLLESPLTAKAKAKEAEKQRKKKQQDSSKETKESKDQKDSSKDSKDSKEQKEPKDAKEAKDSKGSQDGKEVNEGKEETSTK